jgi:UV excision repair protein RAD23
VQYEIITRNSNLDIIFILSRHYFSEQTRESWPNTPSQSTDNRLKKPIAIVTDARVSSFRYHRQFPRFVGQFSNVWSINALSISNIHLLGDPSTRKFTAPNDTWPVQKVAEGMQTVSFRPLNGETVKLELSSTATIGECRITLAERFRQGPSKLKLIFRGRVLKDTDVIGSLGIGASDFLVVHAPKLAAAAARPPPAAPTGTAPAAPPRPPPVAPARAVVAPPAHAAAAPQAQPEDTDPAASVQFEQGVHALMELGYPRSDCEAALRAAGGDVNRAADFVAGGDIPEWDDDDGQGNDDMADVRDTLQHNPALLESFIRGMEGGLSPQQVAAVRARPEDLLLYIGIDPETFDQDVLEAVRNGTAPPGGHQEFGPPPPGYGPAPGYGAAPQGGFAAPQGGFAAPQAGYAAPPQGGYGEQAPAPAQPPGNPGQGLLDRFTQEEKDAIQRIANLGSWPLFQVVQIFDACDKNEMLAANLLINSN